MEPVAIILLFGILIPVGIFIARPFMRAQWKTDVKDDNRSILLAEQERLLTALHELDFDHSMRKVPAEDYPAQRAELVRLGAGILEKIDLLPKEAHPALSNQKNESKESETDHWIEELILQRRVEKNKKTGRFCPNCGKAVRLNDRFCTICGHTLK